MGGPPFFENKSQLFSILACHGHTSQRLSILFSDNVTPLSVWTSIFKDWDQQCSPVSVLACQCHTSQRLDPLCELEPGQHDTYIIMIPARGPQTRLLAAGLGNLGSWAWVPELRYLGNPDIRATGSWARQSRYLGLGTWA